MADFKKRLQETNTDYLIGLSTGFEKLDDIIGGFVEGTLVTIGGRTGMGKTAFYELMEKEKNKKEAI